MKLKKYIYHVSDNKKIDKYKILSYCRAKLGKDKYTLSLIAMDKNGYVVDVKLNMMPDISKKNTGYLIDSFTDMGWFDSRRNAENYINNSLCVFNRCCSSNADYDKQNIANKMLSESKTSESDTSH